MSQEEDIKPEIVSQSVNSFINEFIEINEMSIRVAYPSNQDLSTDNLSPHPQGPSNKENGMEDGGAAGGENITIPDTPMPEEGSIFHRSNVLQSHVKTDTDVTGF